MPGSFLTEVDRLALNNFPKTLSLNELNRFYRLSVREIFLAGEQHGDANKLGFALQLCSLRHLGFCPKELETAPSQVVQYLAHQLKVSPATLTDYSQREHTRNDHFRKARDYLGFKVVEEGRLDEWLLARALEHDAPLVLFRELLSYLYQEKLVRPGLTILEGLVAHAREEARRLNFEQLQPFLTPDRKTFLDSLLQKGEGLKISRLEWLKREAISDTPRAILSNLEKLKFLKEQGVEQWDLSALNPNRRRWLAALARRSSTQALTVLKEERRYPLLACFVHATIAELTDQTLELFDSFLAGAYQKAGLDLEEFRRQMARATNEKVHYLRAMGRVVLDKEVSDEQVRQHIFQALPQEKLKVAVEECDQLVRPLDDSYFDFLARSFPTLRQFTPELLATFTFKTTPRYQPLLAAVALLKKLNRERAARLAELRDKKLEANAGGVEEPSTLPYLPLQPLPTNAPQGFISEKWRPYVYQSGPALDKPIGEYKTNLSSDDNAPSQPVQKATSKTKTISSANLNRQYYELPVLWELRQALRAGNIWVEGSRRYARLESYLIPTERWNKEKKEWCELLGLPLDGASHLNALGEELEKWLNEVEQSIKPERDKSGRKKPQTAEATQEEEAYIWIEEGKLKVSSLTAKERPGVKALEEQVSQRLPWLDLPELVAEVDHLTGFSAKLVHAASGEPISQTELPQLYAAILAQATNVGTTAMSRMTDFSRAKLHWLSNWYLQEEPLQEAVKVLVNHQYRQPLARLWGDGTFSSSDGQRFLVTVKTSNAQALPKYFGFGRGLSYYTWTSDQMSQFAIKVIPPTMRESTYALDALLDNETDLLLHSHAVDTGGFTELMFALFHLLGFTFAPRIRDLADQQLYRLGSLKAYPQLKKVIQRTIKQSRIVEQWDEILRVVVSLKLGWVSASLLVSKLQSYPRQNALMLILREYGRLCKTIFSLRYLIEESYRRQIEIQLNKGEHLHALRDQFFIGFGRQLRKHTMTTQTNQASSTNLIVNCIVVWNTLYMQKAVEQLRSEGFEVRDEELSHIWPSRYQHVNVFGRYTFPMEDILARKDLRDLRQPTTTELEEEGEPLAG